MSVGNEWYPYDTKQLLDNSLPALVAFASGALALGLTSRKMDARTALGLFVSLLFGLMLFQARRFVEYFPPFALIFAAFAWTDRPAISFQFHPEFSTDFAKALIEQRYDIVPNPDAAIASLDAPNDSTRVAGWIRRFLQA